MWPKTAERTVAAAVGTRRIAGETVITSVWVWVERARRDARAPDGRRRETGNGREWAGATERGERRRWLLPLLRNSFVTHTHTHTRTGELYEDKSTNNQQSTWPPWSDIVALDRLDNDDRRSRLAFTYNRPVVVRPLLTARTTSTACAAAADTDVVTAAAAALAPRFGCIRWSTSDGTEGWQ